MAITIKSEREIELMAEAGKILERVHNELEKALRPGMSTKDIDTLGEEIIRSYGCIPSFLNYNGYPASICVSVNQEVVHGIPDKHRIIQEGDIVSLDAGVIYKGYHSDAARTHAVGEVSEEAKKLIRVTKESFFEGIKFAKAGNHLFDISGAIGRYAEERGYGEAVVITNEALKKDFRYMIKQNGGMLAKGRLLGVQFDTLFTDDLYFKISAHADELAMKLKKAFQKKGYGLRYDSYTNQQFPILPDSHIEKLKEKYVFEFWEKVSDAESAVRFCTSWATKPEVVEELIRDIEAC